MRKTAADNPIRVDTCNHYIVVFLGGSPWNSTGQPLLLVDPNCILTEQLPGSDIHWMFIYRGRRVEQEYQQPSIFTPVGDLPYHTIQNVQDRAE